MVDKQLDIYRKLVTKSFNTVCKTLTGLEQLSCLKDKSSVFVGRQV